MSIIEMETKLFIFSKQRANLFQARKATGNETDPDWIRKEIKPISDEIDRLDHAIWIARQQQEVPAVAVTAGDTRRDKNTDGENQDPADKIGGTDRPATEDDVMKTELDEALLTVEQQACKA